MFPALRDWFMRNVRYAANIRSPNGSLLTIYYYLFNILFGRRVPGISISARNTSARHPPNTRHDLRIPTTTPVPHSPPQNPSTPSKTLSTKSNSLFLQPRLKCDDSFAV